MRSEDITNYKMRRSNIAEEKMLMMNPPVNLEFEVVHLGLAPVGVLVIL